jgi:hypothetical protein
LPQPAFMSPWPRRPSARPYKSMRCSCRLSCASASRRALAHFALRRHSEIGGGFTCRN